MSCDRGRLDGNARFGLERDGHELFFTPLVVLVEGTEDIAFLSTHLQLTGRWTRFRELGCHFVVTGGKKAEASGTTVWKTVAPYTLPYLGDDFQASKAHRSHPPEHF